MTIPRAKNREFRHVLVLWPFSVTGTPEHQRRLLYDAVTRAKELCSVVVFGQNRTAKAPFARVSAVAVSRLSAFNLFANTVGRVESGLVNGPLEPVEVR